MGNIRYMISRLAKMDYTAMLRKAGAIHKKTGKNRIWILADMVRCARRYGAGYMDYDLFEMYDLTDAQRDTYITRGRNNELIRRYNDKAQNHFFNNKDEFNTAFDDCLKRSWMSMKEADAWEKLDAFLDNNPVFMAKPIDGACGKGIERIDQSKYADRQAVKDYLQSLGENYVLEALIVQHPALSAIYPVAINTLRMVTIRKDGVTHLICAYFRIGNNGKHVDNFNSGGMVAPVDEKTGIVMQPAIDKNKQLYTVHPYTGTPIQGFQFPDWKEAVELVKKGSERIEGMNYIGWDVAFTVNGPVFVEANHFPGHDIYQLPEHTPDKMGIMPKFRV